MPVVQGRPNHGASEPFGEGVGQRRLAGGIGTVDGHDDAEIRGQLFDRGREPLDDCHGAAAICRRYSDARSFSRGWDIRSLAQPTSAVLASTATPR